MNPTPQQKLKELAARIRAERATRGGSAARIFRRMPEVVEMTGKRRSAIYEEIKQGTFPAPIKISRRAAAWDDDEIAAWQELRLAARDAGKAA